ncbi:hypothetical protein DFH09DRAFT_1084961 [Mycena vulgaris]|nr:hypothetical protein DFH09DRAFT_1084961 [Mycena vulgaris]
MSAFCTDKKASCKVLKYCSARFLPSTTLPPLSLDSSASAKEEIFFNTLGFYCTLAEQGCGFHLQTDGEGISPTGLTDDDDDLNPKSASDSDPDESDSETGTRIIKDSRRKKTSHSLCKGKLEVCQHRKKIDKAYLILRTLDEFDIPYLRTLLGNDSQIIQEREELARQFGYGPCAPCSFAASPSEQKQLCREPNPRYFKCPLPASQPYWHRESSKLVLQRQSGNCGANFELYPPYDFVRLPPNCRHLQTPPPLLEVFRSLLLDLGWKLVDATPGKLMIDSGFMGGLRRALGWNTLFDPPLAALHSSLGSLDHVRRYINELRNVLFLEGTGFEGEARLGMEHAVAMTTKRVVAE